MDPQVSVGLVVLVVITMVGVLITAG
jgi:hypothetical protein